MQRDMKGEALSGCFLLWRLANNASKEEQAEAIVREPTFPLFFILLRNQQGYPVVSENPVIFENETTFENEITVTWRVISNAKRAAAKASKVGGVFQLSPF